MCCQHEEGFSLEGPDCPCDTDGPSVRRCQEIDGPVVLLDPELRGPRETLAAAPPPLPESEGTLLQWSRFLQINHRMGFTGVRAALTSWYQTGV